VSTCLTNPSSSLPKVILTASHLSFQLLFFSPAWVLCFSAPPRDAAKPALAQLNLHNTASAANRAASFKSLYRKRANTPCSCVQLAHSRFRYNTKTSRDPRDAQLDYFRIANHPHKAAAHAIPLSRRSDANLPFACRAGPKHFDCSWPSTAFRASLI
jgi:hypothetical protein